MSFFGHDADELQTLCSGIDELVFGVRRNLGVGAFTKGMLLSFRKRMPSPLDT